MASVILVLLRFMLISGCLTVILQAALKLPFLDITVIVVVPGSLAVTFPFEDTVAIFVFSELHLTALFVAFEGKIVTVNCRV